MIFYILIVIMSSTYRIKIRGTVQGVGFRPFVYRLAQKYGLKGEVINSNSGVEIIIQGQKNKINRFFNSLSKNSPIHSQLRSIQINEKINKPSNYKKFKIKRSQNAENSSTHILPDLNVCSECKNELLDPNNRRYFYPFITCTNCGPRFTIINDIPYDRNRTTMSDFDMCPNCEQEYNHPKDRRFHSQTNSCFECGPKLKLYNSDRKLLYNSSSSGQSKKLFQKISNLLQEGKTLIVKSNGGFHLCCNAVNSKAVNKIRTEKKREEKPFGLMFPDLRTIEKYCDLSAPEMDLIKKPGRPLVILDKKEEHKLAENVAPGRNDLAIMLPYNPIQILIFNLINFPLVMTSANITGEPIINKNKRIFEKLSSSIDYICIHNRNISQRCDDSVYRTFRKNQYPIRRSRGYVPESVKINSKCEQNILACGGERKNTFALSKNKDIWISQHIGDLKNLETFNFYESSIQHFKHIFDIKPELIAHDLHPNYLNTRYAEEKAQEGNIQTLPIQHHHAHAVSCMAENHLSGPAIALVLDGTGYGEDAKIWGGEVLITRYSEYTRIGHLDYVDMPGGESAIKNPYRMALGYLYSIFGDELERMRLPSGLDKRRTKIVIEMLKNEINLIKTSSTGRLFAAVAAITGIRSKRNYEGQAAIELESYTNKQLDLKYSYPFYLESEGEGFVIKWDEMIKQGVSDVLDGVSCEDIATKFHNGLAIALKKSVNYVREKTGINNVVLSGGVFMNMYLMDKLVSLLNKEGFEVNWHQKVPTNDGGIALGQLIVAKAKDKRQ